MCRWITILFPDTPLPKNLLSKAKFEARDNRHSTASTRTADQRYIRSLLISVHSLHTQSQSSANFTIERDMWLGSFAKVLSLLLDARAPVPVFTMCRQDGLSRRRTNLWCTHRCNLRYILRLHPE